MTWNGRRVLVTGAGGFIGSHLVERLVALGATTRALVHYNSAGSWGWLDHSPVATQVDVRAGDVRDEACVRRAMEGVEVVFHLAALIGIPYSYEAPHSYVHTNVEGSLHVLQAARAAGVQRVVHTSTSEVYGSAQRIPMDEQHPLVGQSPYSASKIAADQFATAFHRSFGLPVVTVRPFNTFGPRQSARAVIPTIITQALTQPAITLGNVETQRDVTLVLDTVEGFVKAGSTPGVDGEVFNLGTGTHHSVAQLAALIQQVVGVEKPVVVEATRQRPAASEVDRLCADATKAARLLDWKPRHTLEEGLRVTVAFLRENLERYRPTRYTV